jgi:hypothetical protein
VIFSMSADFMLVISCSNCSYSTGNQTSLGPSYFRSQIKCCSFTFCLCSRLPRHSSITFLAPAFIYSSIIPQPWGDNLEFSFDDGLPAEPFSRMGHSCSPPLTRSIGLFISSLAIGNGKLRESRFDVLQVLATLLC